MKDTPENREKFLREKRVLTRFKKSITEARGKNAYERAIAMTGDTNKDWKDTFICSAFIWHHSPYGDDSDLWYKLSGEYASRIDS